MRRGAAILFTTFVLLAVGIYAWQRTKHRNEAVGYRTVPIARSDVVASISATGTVVPEDTIDVGAQVNGLILSFGTGSDGRPIDYRSEVKQGALLATIDDSLYASDVATAEASLGQAQAQVQLSQATRQQSQAQLDKAGGDWARAQKLGVSEAQSQADYDAAKAEFQTAGPAVAVADAQIKAANAQVGIAQAALDRAKKNLDYCTIESPVTGTIIDKRVDIGQTVIASQNAPSLFLLAKDLRKMLVLVQVNEADIGGVVPGQPVSFTVDAVPGVKFAGTIRKVRLNATMTQNVVTYTAEISADNADLKLLPYLTANVTFVTGRRDSVLAVPNAALRFTPAGVTSDPSQVDRNSDATHGRLWTLDSSGRPTLIHVATGLSDGLVTEVQGAGLAAGVAVVTGEGASGAVTAAGSSNPFAPQLMRR